jgi:hypothetical protein
MSLVVVVVMVVSSVGLLLLGLESGFGGAETGVELFEFGFLRVEGLLSVKGRLDGKVGWSNFLVVVCFVFLGGEG